MFKGRWIISAALFLLSASLLRPLPTQFQAFPVRMIFPWENFLSNIGGNCC
jgi:hypothetical protein